MAQERRFALLLEYDGTAYVGSQYQLNGPTVQAALEAAIERLTGERRRVAFAGRTDRGVHAWGQVAAVTTRDRWTAAAIQRGLNALLPDDIAVRAVAEVPPTFNPRREARRRWYRYTIYNAPVRPVLGRRFAWHVREHLEIGAMQRSATWLVGEHDYAAFAGPPSRAGARTVRRVERAEVWRRQEWVFFDIEANAFLPHQVRRTVGALVAVGSGKLSVEEFILRAEAAVPGSLGPSAPGHGLCLMQVSYDRNWFADTGCPLPHPPFCRAEGTAAPTSTCDTD